MKVTIQSGVIGFLSAAVVFALFAPAAEREGVYAAGNDQAAKDAIANSESVGINLDFVVDWTPAWVFKDIFKTSRPWLSQLPDTTQVWDGDFEIETTTYGWPLLQPGQAAATLMMREIEGHYPAGTYTCLYQGTGSVEFGMDATVLSSEPGRILLDVQPTDSGIFFKINESDIDDPIRDVRVIMPGFEDTYLSEPFHPAFIESLKPFGILRYMNWQRINETTVSNWWERTRTRSSTMATDAGVAFEHIVQLARETDTEPWVCIPHLATDEFVISMARLFRRGMSEGQTIYVEFSNEVWNSIFPQAHYAEAQGLAEGLAAEPFQARLHWYSKRANHVLNLFKQVVESGEDHATVVRVMGAQYGNPWTSDVILSFEDAHENVDALAIAPYFGISLGSPSNIWETVDMTKAEIFEACREEILGEQKDLIDGHADIAEKFGLELISYEGGQHMVGYAGSEGVPELTETLIEANRDPAMYDLYTDMLNVWRGRTSAPFVSYSHCREYTQWGSWGALEYQDQPLWEAHKFRALADFNVQD